MPSLRRALLQRPESFIRQPEVVRAQVRHACVMSVVGLRTPLARGAAPAGATHMHDSSLNGLIVYAPGLSAPKSTPTRSLASRLSELLADLLTGPQADLRA